MSENQKINDEGINEKTERDIVLPRRKFLATIGGGLTSIAALNVAIRGNTDNGSIISMSDAANDAHLSLEPAGDKNVFRFAVIADTHIIDDFYKGPEGNPLDTETIFQTSKRLETARKAINGLNPPIEKVFVVGDYFHDYPSADYDFYFQNKTRIDNAKALTDGFKMPVHVGFGNHDYMVPQVSREMSHRLFKQKLGVDPYYSVTHRNCKFIHLNNFQGETWNKDAKNYNKSTGSLGETQLNWFEAELKERKPTFVFIHYPLYSVQATEVRDYGMLPLLKKHKDTIQLIVSGHWHRWFDFARTFGAQHYVMGSTRYDEDAYMIVEVNTKRATNKILNLNLVDWATHYSQPFK